MKGVSESKKDSNSDTCQHATQQGREMAEKQPKRKSYEQKLKKKGLMRQGGRSTNVGENFLQQTAWLD